MCWEDRLELPQALLQAGAANATVAESALNTCNVH